MTTLSLRRASALAAAPMGPVDMARGLGWFSIALGLLEVAAARRLDRWLGLGGQEGAIRLFGFREIATGVAALGLRDPSPAIMARIAGDVLDLAALAGGAARRSARPGAIGVAAMAVLGATALDILCAERLAARRG